MMSSECDRCGKDASECACEEIKEMMRIRRKNLENQNAMLDKFWPWLGSMKIQDDNE